MAELKLRGMVAAFDEAVVQWLRLRRRVEEILGDLLRAEAAERRSRSIRCRLGISRPAGHEGPGELPLRGVAGERGAGAQPARRHLVPGGPQRVILAPLQLRRDQPIVGIDGIMLPAGAARLGARLFEREGDLPLLLARLEPARLDRLNGRFDAKRLQQADDLCAHRLVDTHRAEGDPRLCPMVEKGAAAMVAPDTTPGAAVCDMQLAPAVATAQHAGQGRLAPPHRTALWAISGWFLSYSAQDR
jgi:hypothetical protein